MRKHCIRNVLLGAIAAATPPTAAALDPSGPEFVANQTTDCHQNGSTIAAALDGGFLVAWNDFGASNGLGVYARTFDATGAPLADERLVGSGLEAEVARVGDGYVVAWYNGAIAARRLDAHGQPVGPETRLDSLGGADVGSPQVAALRNGGFAAAWVRGVVPSQRHIFLRRFNALGEPLGTETPVDVSGHAFGPDGGASFDLASAPDGSLAVVWQSQNGVHARFYDPSGFLLRAEIAIHEPGTRPLNGPALAALPEGFVAVWSAQPVGGGPESVVYRRLGGGVATGPVVAAWQVPSDSSTHSPAVVSAANGDFVVLWIEPVEEVGRVFARTIAADGTPTGEPQSLSTSDPFEKQMPRAAFLANAGLAATWTSLSPTAPFPVPFCGLPSADGSGDAVQARLFAPPCGSDTQICLADDHRFTASVQWRDPHNPPASGVGHALALTADTGGFWFFQPRNLELGVKVLDGRAVNGHFWVFYAALTNVEVDLTITDRVTGASRVYHKGAFEFGSAADTSAFPADPPAIALAAAAARAPEPTSSIAIPDSPILPACFVESAALCLQQNRFSAEIAWRTPAGATGTGTAIARSDESGTFWFFDPANIELFVKILDGRAINGRFWVFYAGLTNVEFTLTIHDSEAGAQRGYHNPQGTFPSAADTDAF